MWGIYKSVSSGKDLWDPGNNHKFGRTVQKPSKISGPTLLLFTRYASMDTPIPAGL